MRVEKNGIILYDGHPALNIKVYSFGKDVSDRMRSNGHEISNLDHALDWTFECHANSFFNDADHEVKSTFGECVEVEQCGRSGGWLIIKGLKDPDKWEQEDINKWKRFTEYVYGQIEYYCDTNLIIDTIIKNRWNENGAEEFNFIDTSNGKEICVVDFNRYIEDIKNRILNDEIDITK